MRRYGRLVVPTVTQQTLDLDATATPWRERAACHGHPVAWWFHRPATALAATICAACPVRSDCDADAAEHGDEGFRAFRWRPPAPVPCRNCGEGLGVVELADGASYCDSRCETTHREAMWDEAGHGRTGTYNAGCRCDECTGAIRGSKARSRQRRDTTSDVGPGEHPGPERGEQR